MAKKKNTKIYFSTTRLIIFLILSVVVFCGGLIFKAPIEKLINGSSLEDTEHLIDYNGLLVHYVDVGQADCIVLEFPSGEKMLIDAGKDLKAKDNSKLLEYLDAKVFDKPDEEKVFNYVLLTHSDDDHCGALPEIFSIYQVNKAYRPQIYIDANDKNNDAHKVDNSITKLATSYVNTIKAIQNEPNCEMFYTITSLMNSSQKISGGTGENYFEFTFYAPLKGDYDNSNNFSPIFSLEFKNKVFMFTGDATKDIEKEALKSTLPKVDVLKVGHHGSNTSSSDDFISKIQPTYSVIQVGATNSYGHPTSKTLNTLNYYRSIIYRTDLNHNIIANVTADGNINFYLNVVNKVSVFYLIGGVELVLVSVCFLINYQSFNQPINKTKKHK